MSTYIVPSDNEIHQTLRANRRVDDERATVYKAIHSISGTVRGSPENAFKVAICGKIWK